MATLVAISISKTPGKERKIQEHFSKLWLVTPRPQSARTFMAFARSPNIVLVDSLAFFMRLLKVMTGTLRAQRWKSRDVHKNPPGASIGGPEKQNKIEDAHLFCEVSVALSP